MKNNQAATIYAEVLAAMERGAPFNEIQPLIESLAAIGYIDRTDGFGLTISMHAAALGNLEVVKGARALGASFEVRNELTKANLLHYAAQAMSGGADIINWAILEANAPIELLSERVEGNGHTVAMEATFNNNASAIKALIDIDTSGRKVDLTAPALTGWTPRGFALREKSAFAHDLPPPGQTFEEAQADQRAFATQAEADWVSAHPRDKAAIDLVAELREYILQDVAREPIEALLNSALAGGVDLNACYGRLSQPLLILVPTGLSADKEEQQARYANVVDLLLQKGAKPQIKERSLMRVSAGFRDAVFGYRDGLKRMIEGIPEGEERQTFIDEQGIMNGYTRLNDAAFFGRTDVIKLLLDHGAEKSVKGFNGRTACDAAVIYNNKGTGERIPDHVLGRLCDGQD